MVKSAGKRLGLVAGQLRSWYYEGKRPPNYRHGNCSIYMAYLLDVPYQEIGSWATMEIKIDAKYPNFLDALLGPHGWAVLQAYIIQRQEREKQNESA